MELHFGATLQGRAVSERKKGPVWLPPYKESYSDGQKSCTFFPEFFLWPPWGRGANFGTGQLCKMEFSNCLIFSEEISLVVSE